MSYNNPLNSRLSEVEKKENVVFIYNYLSSCGWSISAICGVLGNFEKESDLNPNVYEGYYVHSSDLGSYGYGLAQWTPWLGTSTYDTAEEQRNYHGSNNPTFGRWCIDNGRDKATMEAQLDYLDLGLGGYRSTSDYPESFESFKKSSESASHCAKAFYVNYERSAAGTWGDRPSCASDWYDFLKDYLGGDIPDPPVDPDPDEPEIPDEPPIHTDWSEVIKDALSHWKLIQTDHTEIGDILYKVAKWAYARASSSKYGVDLENNWGPNYDNATFIISAFEANGIPVKTNGAVNASNLEDIFLRSGFVRLSNAHPYKNADIVVRSYNGQKLFDMVLSPSDYTNGYAYSTASIVDADGKSGDSTDNEIITYWRFPSASDGYYFLRFTGFKEFEPPKTRLSKLLLYAVGSDIV